MKNALVLLHTDFVVDNLCYKERNKSPFNTWLNTLDLIWQSFSKGKSLGVRKAEIPIYQSRLGFRIKQSVIQ
jgi:hypothetical protein